MRATVVTTERLTPSLVRVVLGGDGLPTSDGRVRRHLRQPGVPNAGGGDRPAPLHRARLGGDDPELTIDFVVHGDEGVAGPWAARRPGDTWSSRVPPAATAPTPMPTGTCSSATSPRCRRSRPRSRRSRRHPAVVRLLCDGPDHRLELTCPGGSTSSGCSAPAADRRRAAARRAPRPDVPAGTVYASCTRGRRDPRHPPAPARRAWPPPPGHVLLAQLAPHMNDEAWRNQARL